MTLNFAIDTSRFDPFKYYSAALQTMKDYGTEYRRLEDQMMKIAEQNGQYVLPDTPENQEYRNTIDKYNQAYSAAVESLNRGLNPRLSSDIMKVRRQFLSDVNPIYKAVEAYNKDQDKMTALGPDAIIGNKQRTIRDYYGGVNPGISYRSGKAIQQTAAGVIQGIDNALMQAPELAGSIAKQYFILKQQGLNGNDALAKILKNSQLSSRQNITDASQLIQALDGVYQQYAFDDGTPENSKVWENVVTGAIQGIQAPKYTTQVNHGYESAAQRASREYTELQRDYYREIKNLEEEEKNLKLGKVKVDDGDGKHHYEYNPQKAKEILNLRRTSQEDTSTKVTPHITYGGHRYSVKKVSDIGKGLNTYEVSDIDTGEIITDASLKQGIVDYYNGTSTPPAKIPPSTPQTPQPSTPVDSTSTVQKGKWTS